MSKVGKIPIVIAQGVTVAIQGMQANITGPKGNVSYQIPEGIAVAVQEGKVIVSAQNQQDKKIRALFGLTRANLANVIKGIDKGFEKKLELKGVGYRAQMQGADLV